MTLYLSCKNNQLRSEVNRIALLPDSCQIMMVTLNYGRLIVNLETGEYRCAY